MKTLAETYFFRGLAPRQIEHIKALAEERSFAKGAYIVEVGQELTYLHVIREGRVRVIVPLRTRADAAPGLPPQGDADERDQEERLAEMGPGESIGEFSYADRKPASATVVALEPTRTFALAHQDLDRLLASDAAIARSVLGAMLERVVGQLRRTDADLVLARYVLRVV